MLVCEQEKGKIEQARGVEDGVCMLGLVDCAASTSTSHTKHLPRLTQPPLIYRVEHKDDRVALVVVARPDGPDIPLSAQIEELHDSGRKADLADCSSRGYRSIAK